MGTDVPLACLSDRPQALFSYFKQLFAQVTNPRSRSHPRRAGNVSDQLCLSAQNATFWTRRRTACHTLKLPHPILTNRDHGEAAPRILRRSACRHAPPLSSLPGMARPASSMPLGDLSSYAAHAARSGYTLLILSDRDVDAKLARHSQPAWPWLPFAIAWYAKRPAPRWRSSSRAANRAAVMRFALLIGYGARAPSIPTWRSRPSMT